MVAGSSSRNISPLATSTTPLVVVSSWIDDASQQLEAEGRTARSRERLADHHSLGQRAGYGGDRDQCDLEIEHEVSARAAKRALLTRGQECRPAGPQLRDR